VLSVGGHRVEVLPALHTVPAVGFAVRPEAAGAWVYTGDTGPNPALWERLRDMDVAALVIETAFSDEEHAVAELSRHLCPSTLARELRHLPLQDVAVYITHIKPGEVDAVMEEIGAAGSRLQIRALTTGQHLALDTCGHAA
jgi:ribonuclease BN (tRNA processing enzyme)